MRAGIIAILFLLNAAPAPTQSQYFPNGTFAEQGDAEAFVVTWYSHALKSLEEPSLWELSRNDKHAVVYRFLWLRSFHHPVAIRINIASDGTAEVATKVSSGAGGYDPDRLIEKQTEKLSAIQVKDLIEQVRSAKFWELPTEEKRASFGIDGARWILEGIQDGNYHIVDRWSPKNGAYRALCWFFVSKLARLRIPKDQIY